MNAIRVLGVNETGLPVHLGMRVALESRSAEEAVGKLREAGMAASAHLMVADPEMAYSCEFTASTFDIIRPDEHKRIIHGSPVIYSVEVSLSLSLSIFSSCYFSPLHLFFTLETLVPPFTNHVRHTFPLFFVFFDLFLVDHSYAPKSLKLDLALTGSISLLYMGVLLFIRWR